MRRDKKIHLSKPPRIQVLSRARSFCRNSNDQAPLWRPFCKVDRPKIVDKKK